MALRYHSTGDLQRAGVLQVRYLPTEYMPSDVLTKALPVHLHRRHAAVLLGVSKLNWQRRLQEKEAEEFRLQEKLRGVEVKLEMQNVKLSEMVAREQALLSQVEEYRAAEQHMADGVRGAEVRSKALADSLVEKESTEEELLEKLRQMEMRNGTLQLLLERFLKNIRVALPKSPCS